jgi:hypothetical protein
MIANRVRSKVLQTCAKEFSGMAIPRSPPIQCLHFDQGFIPSYTGGTPVVPTNNTRTVGSGSGPDIQIKRTRNRCPPEGEESPHAGEPAFFRLRALRGILYAFASNRLCCPTTACTRGGTKERYGRGKSRRIARVKIARLRSVRRWFSPFPGAAASSRKDPEQWWSLR